MHVASVAILAQGLIDFETNFTLLVQTKAIVSSGCRLTLVLLLAPCACDCSQEALVSFCFLLVLVFGILKLGGLLT